MFDPHTEAPIVRPAITSSDAAHVAKSAYDLDLASAPKELGSNQDRNFLLTPTSGPRWLLKFDNSAFPTREIEVQNEALLHLAAGGLAVPAPNRDTSGQWLATVQLEDGREVRARLLSFIEGSSLVADGFLFPDAVKRMGALAGGCVRGLSGFTDPVLDRDLQWDMRNALAVVEAYAPEVSAKRRGDVISAARAAWKTVQSVVSDLPIQAIHGDVTDDNVVGPRDGMGCVVPSAVIDWGDLSTGWRVAEIAVQLASMLHHQRGRPLSLLPAITAFSEAVELTPGEITALWPLVVLRGAVLVVSGAHQLAVDSENEYVAERMEHEWRSFEMAASLEPEFALEAVRHAVGLPVSRPSPPPPKSTLFPDGVPYANRLGTAADIMARGSWLKPDFDMGRARAFAYDDSFAVMPFGEHQLTKTKPPSYDLPVNAPLHASVYLGDAERDPVPEIHAPYDGVVDLVEGGIRLSCEYGTIYFCGVVLTAPSGPVTGGSPIGTPGTRVLVLKERERYCQHVKVRWERACVSYCPDYATAETLPIYRRLLYDPSPLLGLEPIPALDPSAEHARRELAVPGAAERYYTHPPQIERGWRSLLIDTAARCYLDMVNNVAAIGHAHPRLADAVHKQLLTLNTNSRFLYKSLADYTERLAALLSPHLCKVLLVNSGSEAVDLALTLARAHTRRSDVLCLREAYHGWTSASDAVSTAAWENPDAAASRPASVHVADMPSALRNPQTDYAASAVALVNKLTTDGTPVGAFIAEPVFGNGGGVLFPPRYLETVYAAVRAHGGVCIADEVQVGLGRLGHHTWGFEAAGVVPDIVCVAKALGASYPLGAVITTAEIAESLEREGMFFSSAGGATASAVAGLAVLDVLRDEKLQENAAVVGDYLSAEFAQLQARYTIIGAVHGMGLYQGIELILPGGEPAQRETAWVCERLLDYGVICQPTSERRNVLKVKPPMTLTKEEAGIFVNALEAVLGELEARLKE